jgi:hypothetical protein
MTDKSSIGDWAFLVGSVGAVGGYLAYENMDQVNGLADGNADPGGPHKTSWQWQQMSAWPHGWPQIGA